MENSIEFFLNTHLEWSLSHQDSVITNDLLNDLGFNLCVAPRSPVVRLVAYFGVVEVVKTEVLRGQVRESEWTR